MANTIYYSVTQPFYPVVIVREFISERLLPACCHCLLMGLLLCGRLDAQSGGRPYFRNYSTDEGLASPEVHDIIQDRRGYLWIATDNGISRFDGYYFRNFGAQQGLKNNVVFYLQEDELGRIWMQTMSGNIYYYEQDSIYPYQYNHIIGRYNDYFSSIYDFRLLADGTLYVALYGIGILKIDPDGAHRFINADHLRNIVILDLPGYERSLFVTLSTLGVNYFGWDRSLLADHHRVGRYSDTLRDSFYLTKQYQDYFSYSYADPDMLMINSGRYIVLAGRSSFLGFVKAPTSVAELTKIEDAFWMGLNDRQGVRLYQKRDDILQDKYQLFLPGKSISAICPDRSGGYWFGSLNDGIFYAPNLEWKAYLTEDIPANYVVTTMEKGAGDQLLLGTDKGAVYQLDSSFRTSLLYTHTSHVYDLWYNAPDHSLWIAGNPLLVLDGSEERQVVYSPALDYTNGVSAKKIHPARRPGTAFTTSGIGFEVIDTDREEVIFTTLHQPKQKRGMTALEDFSGEIWVGNTLGVFQFKDEQFLPPPVDHPLFSIRVEDLAQLADSTLVIATKGGGLLLWKGDSVEVIDESKGLILNMIENLEIDSRQQIWVGTLNGLNKLSRDAESKLWRVERITMAHGLPSNEIIDLCEASGYMHVVTSRGINRLPVTGTVQALLPAVQLETVLVNGVETDPVLLARLGFRQRNVQLQFVCINYKFDGDITYRYRLTSDGGWAYTQDRSVNYAALAPGQYTFEVQAQNEDGIWGESLQLPFHIATPFWQRWWFVLLVVAGVAFLLYYLYRRRIARLEKEATVEREISELQRSALQAQMNPHFIFNCLNAIQNFIATGEKENAMQYLSRFAMLVRTTLHASTQSTISLEEEIQLIENYLELEKLRFGARFEYTIDIDPRLDHFDTLLPPLLVQPFVENAIIHGFRFPDSSTTGTIHLAYQQESSYLRITILDNGIGIRHSQRNKADSPELTRSLGMSITEKRLKLQSSATNGQSLQVNELYDTEGRIAGTEIVIRIKL